MKKTKSETKKTQVKEKKSKKLYIILAIVLILIVGIFAAYNYLFSSKTIVGYIDNFQGDVKILSNGVWKNVVLPQDLNVNDKIKTNQGTATIVLQEKVLMDIEKNSEIEIATLLENNIKIKQNSGNTWSKFLGVLGVDKYSVETPNAVAIVRSTEFGMSLNDVTQLLVGEGKVSFGKDDNIKDYIEYEKVEFSPKTGHKKLNLTNDDVKLILEKKQKTLKNLKNLRLVELEKNSVVLNQIKKQFSLTDADIKMKLDEIDRGEFDDNILIEKSPVKVDSLYKIKRINDEIKKIQDEIKITKDKISNN